MTKSFLIVGGLLLAVFLGCLLGSAMGALAGLIVGLFFDGSLKLLAQALGIPQAEPYQLGAIFGFIGGFFRSVSK